MMLPVCVTLCLIICLFLIATPEDDLGFGSQSRFLGGLVLTETNKQVPFGQLV